MPDYNDFLSRIYEVLKPFAKHGLILNEDSELVTELVRLGYRDGCDSLFVFTAPANTGTFQALKHRAAQRAGPNTWSVT